MNEPLIGQRKLITPKDSISAISPNKKRMAVTATVSQEFDVMKDNTTSMMIGGMAGTTTTIKMTISGGDPSNLNPVGGMVNEAGVGGAGGISTQVQVAWANAPM